MTREDITNNFMYQVTDAALDYYTNFFMKECTKYSDGQLAYEITEAFEAGAKWCKEKEQDLLNKEVFILFKVIKDNISIDSFSFIAAFSTLEDAESYKKIQEEKNRNTEYSIQSFTSNSK